MRVKGRGEGHGAEGDEVETSVYYERISAVVEKNLGESALKNQKVITIRLESKRYNNLDFIRYHNQATTSNLHLATTIRQAGRQTVRQAGIATLGVNINASTRKKFTVTQTSTHNGPVAHTREKEQWNGRGDGGKGKRKRRRRRI